MSDRRPQDLYQDRVEIPFSHAQVTAGFITKVWKAPRKFRFDGTDYFNQTGLAEDGTNFFAVGVANVSKALTFTAFTFTAATTGYLALKKREQMKVPAARKDVGA